MNLGNIKKEARIQFRKKRKKNILLTEKYILLQVEKLIKNLLDKTYCENFIGIYWPLEDEVDLRSLKKLSKLPLALPASNERGEISYHKWTNSILKKDAYGIPSPLAEPALKPNQIRLLLVPALAIDHNGTRLGYGGGCFDRLRSNPSWKEIEALAVLPSVCISSSLLPEEKWDIPFDGWINEKEVFKIHK